MTEQEQEQEQVEVQAEPEFRPERFDIKFVSPTSGVVKQERVFGWVLGDTGLGYYPHPFTDERVRPTHLPTGYALAHDYMTLENCKAYLREIASKTDWHNISEKGPPLELRKELSAIRDKYTTVPWENSED